MKITIYELLEMIKDDKAPKKIKYNNDIYEYEDCDYFDINRGYLFDRYNVSGILNDEVEILEEEPRDIEVCGSLFTKSEYDKLAHSEEEKKIPEKIPEEIIVGKKQPVHRIKKIEKKINEIISYLESREK